MYFYDIVLGETPVAWKNEQNTTFILIINKRKIFLFFIYKTLKLNLDMMCRRHLEYSSVSVQAKLGSYSVYSVQTNQGRKVDNKLKVG